MRGQPHLTFVSIFFFLFFGIHIFAALEPHWRPNLDSDNSLEGDTRGG